MANRATRAYARFAVLALMLSCAPRALAQSCPASYGSLSLLDSFYTVSQQRSGAPTTCAPSEGGGTVCRFTCVYSEAARPAMTSLGVDLSWYTSPSANGRPRIGGMCEAEGGLTVPGRQITARVNPRGAVTFEQGAAFARTLLAAHAAEAIPCPSSGSPPPTPGALTTVDRAAPASVILMYQGRTFATRYERGMQDGVPIDMYFYRTETMMAPGLPPPQGDAEWSRFVRVPADGVAGAAPVWWHARWDFSASGWRVITERDVPMPQVLR